VIDIIKGLVIFAAYFGAAPVWGIIISKNRLLEDATFYGFIFLMGLHIDTTVLMLGSIEWYRGVTKGYEFSMIDVAAISLVVCALMDKGRRFHWCPPGTLLWMLYVFICSLSIFTALQMDYVVMNILKFSKAWILVYATMNYLRSEREVRILLDAISVMIIYQCFIVVKMKYIDGFYQVRGLFEHQNPLSMYTYMAVLPLLAACLSNRLSYLRSLVYLAGFGAGAVIILSALSRAALALFAVGAVLVVGCGIVLKPSVKRLGVAGLGALGAAVMLAATLDTIVSRFNDEGNEASGETREVMNLASVAMADDKFLGVGWNNFGKGINHPYPYGDVIDDWNRDRGQKVDEDYAKGVVESIYYLHLGENGYPGLIILLIVMGMQLFRAGWLILWKRKHFAGDLAIGIFSALLVTAAHLQLERVLTQTKNLALWMVMFGLIGALWRSGSWESEELADGKGPDTK
jgi:hypothetical protein